MRFVALVGLILSSSSMALAAPANLKADCREVLSPSRSVSEHAIAELRAAGPAGLDALLEFQGNSSDPTLVPAIDAVAGQLHADISRLYWYTDVDRAIAAATAQQKPILYLRLLGRLTDEYSCANSRFFRTILYSNSKVSAYLRENYVLVWCSERPVPVVTIDFGDGRIMKRTLTGNSIHYILDSHGNVMDALPGVFSPQAFMSALIVGRRGGRGVEREEDALLRQWQHDLDRVEPGMLAEELRKLPPANGGAQAAMGMAVSKRVVEMPLLRQVAPQFADVIDSSIERAQGETWEKIASLHVGEVSLDEASKSLMRSQNPEVYADPAALDEAVESFEKLIAMDTVRNNYLLRRQILAWMRASKFPMGVEDLNRRVYSELFLTPRSDAWLGLESKDMYTALPKDGLITPNAALARN